MPRLAPRTQRDFQWAGSITIPAGAKQGQELEIPGSGPAGAETIILEIV